MYKKILNLLNISVILLLPLMTYINIGHYKTNISFADPLIVIILLILFKEYKFFFSKKRKWILIYFVGLILSLVMSHLTGLFNQSFITAPVTVLILEIIKTATVAIYFLYSYFINQNTNSNKQTLLAISFSVLPVLIIGYTSFIQRFVGFKGTFNLFMIPNFTPRFIGTFKDPNLCAFYLCMIIFISIYNLKLIRHKVSRIFLYLIIYGSIGAIALTMSRGGLVAFVIGSIFLIYQNKQQFRFKYLLYLLPLLIIGLLFIYVDLNYQNGTVSQYFIDRVAATSKMDTLTESRLELSIAAIEMGNDNVLLGVGKGSFQLNSDKYLGSNNPNYIYQYIPHNTLASIYAQQGLIGIIIFMSLFIYIIRNLLHKENTNYSFFFTLILVWFIQSLTINIENIRFFWYFWGFLLSFEEHINLMTSNEP